MKRRYPITLYVSIYTAFISGIMIPLFETIRRWEEIGEMTYFLNWFDGYLVGGFLIFAAIKALQSPSSGQRFLCAAWGIATGMAFMSLFRQLEQMDDLEQLENTKTLMLVLKALMLLIAFICMVMTVERYYIPTYLQEENPQ